MTRKTTICLLAAVFMCLASAGCTNLTYSPYASTVNNGHLQRSRQPAAQRQRASQLNAWTNSLSASNLVDQRKPAASARTFPTRVPPQQRALSSSNNNAAHRSFNNAWTNPLSAITFNMKHRDRPDQLAIMASHLYKDLPRPPDFILCQEVVFNRPQRKGRDNTAAVLADYLGYTSKGTKRTSDREGLAIISKYPFYYYDEQHLSSRTNALILGFRRVSVMGEFIVPSLGRVRVVNVHLAHWNFEQHVRYEQLQETLIWIAQRERQVHADVTILGGDFNSNPGDIVMSLLTDPRVVGDLQFHDFNSDQPTKGSAGEFFRRIDYLFVSAKNRTSVAGREQLLWKDGLPTLIGEERFWLSDHLPVSHVYAIGPYARDRRLSRATPRTQRSTIIAGQFVDRPPRIQRRVYTP